MFTGIKLTHDHLVDIQTWTVCGPSEKESVKFKAVTIVFKY